MSQVRIATRREFLTGGLGLVGVGAALPTFLVETALAGPKARAGESILVVLQLSGGHDGLSALVPYRNDDYARNRTATRIAASEVIKVNDDIGLHPNLKGFRDLLDQRAFAALQGVGYPNPNRSHFTSMDIWHAADPSGKPFQSGWIGRYGDAQPAPRDAKLVVAIGDDRAPRAIQGKEYIGLSLQRPEAFRYHPGRFNTRLAAAHQKLAQRASGDTRNANLHYIARTAVEANTGSEAINKLAQGRPGAPSYPTSPLGAALRTVANLIAGGLTTRIYYVFQGGYDTHAGQRQRHDRLMTELSTALVTFQKDLAAQGNADRVLTMLFSEFGRRVRENGSQGTDHGAAGPMFLIGRKVKPGLHGRCPSLAAADLQQGDLKYAIDFRSVYATALERWLGTPSKPILGDSYPLLDCLSAARS